MAERRLIETGSPFEANYAYSRAMVRGDWCFIAGVTGYDYATMTLPDDVAAQAENCFTTIASVLAEAGFAMEDIVRVQHTMVDRADLEAVAPAFRRALGEIRPPATLVIAGLVQPEMRIEIEVTAFRG
ncbi:MAG: RidA family protein [Pseudomonadota bacterium]